MNVAHSLSEEEKECEILFIRCSCTVHYIIKFTILTCEEVRILYLYIPTSIGNSKWCNYFRRIIGLFMYKLSIV